VISQARGSAVKSAADTSVRGRSLTLLAASLGIAVVQLDVSVVNVAIRSIGLDLGDTITGMQWVVSAYTLAFAALVLSAGALGDRVGAKRVFACGFALFTLASAACALAPDLGLLVGARAVQGIGAAVLVPCSLTLLTHAYPDAKARARAIGLWAAGASAALSAGPLIGGLLIASLGWRAIFLINAPIGLAGITLTLRYARETTRSTGRGLDLPGQVTAIVALAALAAAMIEGGEHGFAAALVLCCFATAVTAGAAFLIIESRRVQPMLPLGLFRSRTFAAASSIGLAINIAFYGLIFVFSLYFQTTRHYSALLTGLAFAPVTVAVLAGNLLAGGMANAIGARRLIAAGAAGIAVSLAGLLVVGSGTRYPAIGAQLIVLGFGLGLLVPAMTSALLGSVDTARSGVASGTLNAARQAGSVIGVAVFGSLCSADLVSGLRLAVLISVVLALAVLALSTAVENRPGSSPIAATGREPPACTGSIGS
jgi:MFS transporter, DHA2 family, methylenomycin A resistance protein